MPSVDRRIVEMRFDNKDFETGVSTSISSLDKLKQSLKLKDATDGFDELGRAAEAVSSKFTALGTIGDQILRNIGNEIYSLKYKFEALVKSMSTDQLIAGWDKYADKTSAVKTIMSATADQFENEAEQMEYVNEQLDKLNWFTDETSYRLTDMTDNIGKFTNQGVALDQAVRAMEGIATWAGLSGANVNEASRAMYNLSQALGIGAVTLIDWKSISNANMATKEFKETALETAVAVGTLKKVSDDTYKTLNGTEVTIKNFDQTLSERWFSSEVLTQTLDKFGGFAEILSDKINQLWNEKDADITTSRYLSFIEQYNEGTLDLEEAAKETNQTVVELEADLKRLGSVEYDLGRRAFVAAQQAKTFQEAIDATKDAVSSKWMTTFEIIFGKYTDARKLWTDLSNELWNIFAKGLEERNDVLKEWAEDENGGFQALWKAVYTFWDGMRRIGKRSKEVWNAVFPKLTVEGLIKLVTKLNEQASEFKDRVESMITLLSDLGEEGSRARDWTDDLRDVVGGLRSALELLVHVFNELARFVGFPAIEGLFGIFKWGLSVIAPFTKKFSEFVTKIKETKQLRRLFDGITNWLRELKDNLKEQENFKKFLEYWQEFTNWLNDLKESALNRITKFIDNLGNMDVQLPNIQKVAEFLNKLFGYINQLIELAKKAPNAWQAIKDFFAGLDFSSISNLASSASQFVSQFFQNLFSDEKLQGAGRSWVISIWNGMKNGAGEIDGDKLFETILKTIKVGVGAKLTYSLSVFFSRLSKLPVSAVSIMDQLKNVLYSFTKVLNATAFLQISVGIIALASAMLILASIPTEKLPSVAASMAMVILALVPLLKVISLFFGAGEYGSGNKITGIRKVVFNFSRLGPILIGLGVAIASIVFAIGKLQEVIGLVGTDGIKAITRQVLLIMGAILFLAFELTILGINISKRTDLVGFGGKILALSVAVIAFTLALQLIVSAVVKIANLIKDLHTDKSTKIVRQAIGFIAGLMIAMGIMIGLAMEGQGSLKSVVLIASLFYAFYKILDPIFQFVRSMVQLRVDWPILFAILAGLALVIASLGFVIMAINHIEIRGTAQFSMLIAIAVAVVALAGALALLKDADPGNVVAMAAILIGLVTLFTILGGIVGNYDSLSKGLKIVTMAITGLGVAIALAGVGALALAKALQIISGLSGNLRKIGKDFGEGIAGFFEGLNGAEDQILAFVGKIVAVVLGAIIAARADITFLGSEVLKSFAAGLIKSKVVIILAIAALITAALEYFGLNVDSIVTYLLYSIALICTSLAKGIYETAGPLKKAILDLVHASLYLINEVIIGLLQEIKTILAPKGNGPLAAIMDMLLTPFTKLEYALNPRVQIKDEDGHFRMVSPYIDQLDSDITTIRGAMDDVSKTIIDGGSDVSEAVDDASQEVGTSVETGFIHIANNAASGFGKFGSDDTLRTVRNVGRKFGDAAKEGAEDSLEEHSPSKAFARIGSFAAVGFINAILENTDNAFNATSDLGEEALDGMTSVISQISDAIDSDLDLDPTIRPVLDLSEIQNGSARIGSLLGTNAYAFAPDLSYTMSRARNVTASTAQLNLSNVEMSEMMMSMQEDLDALNTSNQLMATIIERYLPYMPDIANMEVVMDSGTLVGELTPKMDKSLGERATKSRRR